MSETYSPNALAIYKNLYFNVNETSPTEVHDRVASCIANNDKERQDFFELLENRIFRPNTPCLLNAKRPEEINENTKPHDMNLAACFVLELKDDMESIIKMWETCAKIYAGGGGAGLPLSNLREKDAPISSGGKSSGALRYLDVIQSISETVRSGGKSRRAANLTSFRYNHPDIMEYIYCKTGGKLSSVNISVLVPDEFMEDVLNKNWTKNINLISPYKNRITGTITVGELWKSLVEQAWKTGDPGLLFYDEANRRHAFPSLGLVEAANPCLPIWATILTPDGYTRLQYLENRIFINGSAHNCSDKFETGKDKKVFKITLESGLTQYMTNNHKILVYEDDQFIKKELKNIAVNSKVKPDYNPVKYNHIQETDPDFLKGFWAGNLYFHGILNKNDIKFLYPEDLTESQFFNTIAKDFLLNMDDNEKFTILGTNSKRLFELLNKSLPYQLGFLRYYIDYISIDSSKERKFPLKEIHQDLQLILASVGIYSKTVYESEEILKLKIEDIESLLKIDILSNKEFKEKYKEHINNPDILRLKNDYQLITKIEKLEGEFDVFDITVPDTGLFVSGGIQISNCGEVLLPANSMCNLGSINLNKCLAILDGKYVFNFELLKSYIKTATVFLDNVIDKTSYPHDGFKQRMTFERPIGLGIMGLADIFFKMNIPYGSQQSIDLFENICKVLTRTAFETSIDMCYIDKKKPIEIPEVDKQHFEDRLRYFGISDDYITRYHESGIRNSTVDSIAPTGSISITCDASYAFEPCFALIWSKKLVDRDETLYFVNTIFEEALNKRGIELTDKIKAKISTNKGSCQGIEEIPEDIQKVFVTAFDVGWKKKIEMQKAGQRWITLGISSTCNLPASATIEDVEEAYILAWTSNLKGITVYRDGSLDTQPVNFGAEDKKKKEETKSDQVTQNTTTLPLVELEQMKRPMKRLGTTLEILTPHGKLYLTGNVDKNDKLFEIFLRMGKQGHVTNILLDALGKVISKGLQYGVPLKAIIDTMNQCGGFPFFFKIDDDIEKSEQAESIIDAIAKLVDYHFNNNQNLTYQDKIESTLSKCPQCGEMTLVIGSGCRGGSCANPECGYSKCG